MDLLPHDEQTHNKNNEFTHNQVIIKGKRTKRHRPLSPATLFPLHHPSSSTSDVSTTSDICSATINHHQLAPVTPLIAMTAADVSDEDSTTAEEEDMAKCLILLSCGPHKPVVQVAEEDDDHLGVARKFNSRKFMAAAGPTGGGAYVYECKTCSKTFNSFQALGGHRASHKKPKLGPPPSPTYKEAAHPAHRRPIFFDDDDWVAIGPTTTTSKAGRIHECSVCGAQFSSGQALGGHMRRHRPIANITATAHPVVTALDLDLNLPAPPEDLRHEAQAPRQQQTEIVMSAPTLVDCHY